MKAGKGCLIAWGRRLPACCYLAITPTSATSLERQYARRAYPGDTWSTPELDFERALDLLALHCHWRDAVSGSGNLAHLVASRRLGRIQRLVSGDDESLAG